MLVRSHAQRLAQQTLYGARRSISVVSVEKFEKENVAKITFDDGKMNVFSFDAIAQWEKALDDCKGAGSLIVTGNANAMSAGFDLTVMSKFPSEDAAELLRQGGELMLRLGEWKRPVVLAAPGHTLALGAIMLFNCDLRIGVSDKPKAKFGLNEVAIGLPVPTSGMVSARNRLSRRYLYRATVLAEVFGAEEAVQAGYLDYLVTSDKLQEEALKRATSFAKFSTRAYMGTKYMATGFDFEKARKCLAADVDSFKPKK
jgi:enoyl-CoA hydratase